MFKRTSAVFTFLLAVLAAGILLALQQPAVSQTTTLALKGQSSHPASSRTDVAYAVISDMDSRC